MSSELLESGQLISLERRSGGTCCYYCFAAGNGGMHFDEQIYIGPRDMTEDQIDDLCHKLDADLGPMPSGYRGWEVIKLDGHGTFRKQRDEYGKKLEKKDAELEDLRKRLKNLRDKFEV